MGNGEQEDESLKEEMGHLIEEARMLLPGIQALFGFETIAVFNQRFENLPTLAKGSHLLALALVVLAMGMVMAPAAYHRIAEPGRVSRRTLRLSSLLICWGLAPLAVGIALDIYVVFWLATASAGASVASAVVVLILLLGLWFAFPLAARRRAQ